VSKPTKRRIVVAGGTGNVGAFLVRGLLENGDTVVVPSRSAGKLDELKAYLARHLDARSLGRLYTLVGDLVDDAQGEALRRDLEATTGTPDAVIASLGRFQPTASLLATARTDLEAVLHDYLYAHFAVARRFLPELNGRGGTYVFVNGPLAFEVSDGSALVSIATAAQHMLFNSLARELNGGNVQVFELVNYAFIRNRQTQPSSALRGEEVGACVAHLLSRTGRELHGRSIHLRDKKSLAQPPRSASA
jgi:NAD(P)-dependent dehydrogenase (short-subunit alcohol dehydrogenase family)